VNPPALNRSDYPYTPHFCEENIWQLGNALCPPLAPAEGEVWLFSGFHEAFPIMAQRKFGLDKPTWWDYHVVLAHLPTRHVYDFDSFLPFPCPIANYLRVSFEPTRVVPPDWQAHIRRVPLPRYLSHFHSDRSHMLTKKGLPRMPFPPWAALTPPDSPLFLHDLIDIHAEISGIPGFQIWQDVLEEMVEGGLI
jgi:hypothetical protein